MTEHRHLCLRCREEQDTLFCEWCGSKTQEYPEIWRLMIEQTCHECGKITQLYRVDWMDNGNSGSAESLFGNICIDYCYNCEKVTAQANEIRKAKKKRAGYHESLGSSRDSHTGSDAGRGILLPDVETKRQFPDPRSYVGSVK